MQKDLVYKLFTEFVKTSCGHQNFQVLNSGDFFIQTVIQFFYEASYFLIRKYVKLLRKINKINVNV